MAMKVSPPQRKLVVVYRRVNELIPYANNPRHHSPAQLKKLRKLLQAQGILNPILVDEGGNVIAGHARLSCAIELGMEMVPTICIAGMSEADKRAYIIADNAIASQAGWSKQALRVELQGLVDLGYDVELTAFDSLEIDTLLTFEEPEAKADDSVQVPSSEKVALCRVGDLWHAGPHRLIIGDTRNPAILDRLMAGKLAQLIFTDPPFGCRISNNVSGNGRTQHGDFVMGCDGVGVELSQGLLRPAFRAMRTHVQPGGIAFVCMDWRGAPALLDAAQGVFHEVKNLIVWTKTNSSLGTFYRSAHELIYAFKVSPGAHINNFGLRRHRSNVWTYPGANVFRAGRLEDLSDHPTVKPKALVADALLDCTKPGGIVLDGFAGSGTTLVAAAMTNRIGYAVELDPHFADVILRRVSAEIGCEPLLDGETPLSVVAAARGHIGLELANG